MWLLCRSRCSACGVWPRLSHQELYLASHITYVRVSPSTTTPLNPCLPNPLALCSAGRWIGTPGIYNASSRSSLGRWEIVLILRHVSNARGDHQPLGHASRMPLLWPL